MHLFGLFENCRALLEDEVELGEWLCNGHGDMSDTAGDIDYF